MRISYFLTFILMLLTTSFKQLSLGSTLTTNTATILTTASILTTFPPSTSATQHNQKSTTPTQTTTTATSKKFPFQHVIDLLGPRQVVDVVFIMGRTLGIGKRNFYQKGRWLTTALLKQYTSVHRDFARIAYITFASNSSIDYDDVSNDTAPLDKCQLFPSLHQNSTKASTTFPLDSVAYRGEEETSAAGINGAISKANAIFQAGKSNRPNAQQILFLVIDANFKTIDITVTPDPSITVFGIGVGAFYTAAALKGLVRITDNYAFSDEWFKLTNAYLPQKLYANPLHEYNVPESTCSSLDSPLHYHPSNTDCFCDVDYGVIRLQCKPAYVDVQDDQETKYTDYGYSRSCKNESNFRDSCKFDHCTGKLCRKTQENCYDNQLICNRQCSNGANCLEIKQGIFCRCIEGFYGPNCAFNEDDCRFENICQNNGTCIDDGKENKNFKCNCSQGFFGDFCENAQSTLGPKPTTVILPPSFNVKTSTIVGIAVAAFVALAILIGIIVLIAMVMRNRSKNRRNYTRSEMGTSTEASGSVSKWSVKNRNNLSVRLNKLWKQRSLRGFKANDGMPSVPRKTNTKISEMDLQNVSQEEAILENEVIHDNRPVMDNWKSFLVNLVTKGTIKKGLMVNVFTKDIITTEDWEFNWSEVYTLDTVFGTDTNVNVQDDDYYLRAPEDGVASGKSGSQYSNDNQNLLAVAKTKKYLIVGIVPLSDIQDGSECIKEVQLIMKHVKSEGY